MKFFVELDFFVSFSKLCKLRLSLSIKPILTINYFFILPFIFTIIVVSESFQGSDVILVECFRWLNELYDDRGELFDSFLKGFMIKEESNDNKGKDLVFLKSGKWTPLCFIYFFIFLHVSFQIISSIPIKWC